MESYLYRMLMGSGTEIVSAVYLVCILLIAVFKPACIERKLLFRVACIFYALSIFSPYVATAVTPGLDVARIARSGAPMASTLSLLTGPLFLGISIGLALISISLNDNTQ